MKRTYHNHDIEDYIDYHDIQYILHITIVDNYTCIVKLAITTSVDTNKIWHYINTG